MEARRLDTRIGFRLDRLRFGEWLIGVAGLALAIDLLAMPWYSLTSRFRATSAGFGAARSATGFEAHHILGPFVIVCALLGIACWCLQATRRGPALPVCVTVITAVLTLVVSVALLVRVVVDPPAVLVHAAPGVDPIKTDVGAVLGIVLAWALCAGTWFSLRTDGIAEADAPRRIETLRLAQRSAS